MHISSALWALVAAAACSSGLALPSHNGLTARGLVPSGKVMKCYTFAEGVEKGPVDTIHIWERVYRDKSNIKDPPKDNPENSDIINHKDYKDNEDKIGGSPFDILAARVVQTGEVRWYESGMETRGGWKQTVANAKGMPIRGYMNQLDTTEQQKTEENKIVECYYKGVLEKGGAITSITALNKQAHAYVKNKTYEFAVTDCVTMTNSLLSKMKFGKAKAAGASTKKTGTGKAHETQPQAEHEA